ncbi:hypothetical protein AB835_11585 [Candidatus Endobugula sertula]|uniref:DUF2169 domain-containing protein n=1 Tax=Candidatus Endobugula sertula TaxID=62101 RepID=A0A1D2QN03_9GAMM|nr:hypothetical protein AB835_11585 [Candidatus Endobugula sertula]
MQVIKPKRLGIIHKTYQLKHHHFSVGALAFFPLIENWANTGKLLEEYDQWPKCISQLPMGEPLDMGFAKPRSEVLMSAKGYPYQHGLLYQCKAGFEIGSIKKTIRVPRWNKSILTEFMPQAITGKQRRQYNGTYDKHWVDNIHPGFPEDTNTLLFNSATKNQQLSKRFSRNAYFEPGMEYKLHDVHPEKKVIEGKLPNIKVRLFVTLK